MLGRGNYLEGALDPEAERLIREAVTASWDQDFVNSEAGAPAVEDVVFRRHDNTVRFVVPWIDSVRPLRGVEDSGFRLRLRLVGACVCPLLSRGRRLRNRSSVGRCLSRAHEGG